MTIFSAPLLHVSGVSAKHAPVILLFPGWLHPWEKEPEFLARLQQRARVVSVQLPGYLETPDARGGYDFASLAGQIQHELDALGVENPTAVGFSLGCRLLWEWDRQGARTAPTVLIGCPVVSRPIPQWARFALSSGTLMAAVRRSEGLKRWVVTHALGLLRGEPQPPFQGSHVSVTGAFDSLIAYLRASLEPAEYPRDAEYVYGSEDAFLKDALQQGLPHVHVMAGAPHRCVRGHEEEILPLLRVSP